MLITSCASVIDMNIKHDIQLPQETAKPADRQHMPPPAAPDFVPAQDDLSPLRTRIVDIFARNTPLRDVLFGISEATGLNLVIEREVDAETPVTITLKNATAEDALSSVATTVDCFYTVKNNMLLIKATDTKTFELGHPAVVHSYSTDLGGDMLGSAASLTAGGGSSGGTSNVRGSISQKTESDATAYKFWDVIELSLAKIMDISDSKAPAASVQQSPSRPTPPTAAVTGVASGTAANQPPAASVMSVAVEQSRQPVRQNFTVNRLTGTIVVTATKKNMEKVENYLDTIRKVIGRQVLIEAKIVEVSLSDALKFGIDWNFLINARDSQFLSIGTSAFNKVVGATSPVFAVTSSTSDFTSALRALQTQGDIRTLSNPRVSIMNGQTSILGVGRNQNFISKVETTSSGNPPVTTYTVTTSSVLSGIMIGMVPFINESGEISLTITPILSSLYTMVDRGIGCQSSGALTGSQDCASTIQLPTVDVREMSTTVKVRNGQLIVIGGLISSEEKQTDDQIPFLGNIPILGYAFKSRDHLKSKTELVILLQPHIISR